MGLSLINLWITPLWLDAIYNSQGIWPASIIFYMLFDYIPVGSYDRRPAPLPRFICMPRVTNIIFFPHGYHWAQDYLKVRFLYGCSFNIHDGPQIHQPSSQVLILLPRIVF